METIPDYLILSCPSMPRFGEPKCSSDCAHSTPGNTTASFKSLKSPSHAAHLPALKTEILDATRLVVCSLSVLTCSVVVWASKEGMLSRPSLIW